MARRLRWSEEASDDLEEIAAYIARDSRMYAASFVRRIRRESRPMKPPTLPCYTDQVEESQCR